MASRGKYVQQDHMYSADFETCDDMSKPIHDLIVDKETGIITPIYPQRVWLAGIKNLSTMRSSYFTDLTDFMHRILARGDNQNIEIAFHNLRFDGSYIVPWLLRRGFTSVMKRPEKGEFSVLIDKMNNWYMITIQVTKRRKVTIWDSAKLFPTKLANMHEIYGTPTKKIKEPQTFYNLVRDEDHVLTAEERMYFENDLTVLAETLNEHILHYGPQFKKTQASQAFYEFEKHFPSWKRRFPALSEDVDTDIRPAYWGGISYCSPMHQGKDCYNIGVYDINSSYPYQQAYNKLPYGEVVYTYENGEHPDMTKFWISEALVDFTLKPGCVPCIPKRSIEENIPDTSDRWLSSSDGVVLMKFCNIDYLTMHESYNIEIIEWVKTIHFAWKVHPEIQSYILMNNEEKVKNKILAQNAVDETMKIQYTTMSNRAKINNNAYYGKFGEDIIKESKTAYLLDDVDEIVYVQDNIEVQKEGKRKYLPVAIATTAWGRHQLVKLANTLGDTFLYCDTDSVHYLEEKGNAIIEAAAAEGKFEISKTKLGAWKHEGHFDRGRYLRSKCYYEENYKDLYPEVTLAGLPADEVQPDEVLLKFNKAKRRTCCTWDNFHIGLQIPDGNGKFQSVRTPTGNKLIPTKFEITEKLNVFAF